MNTKFKVLPTVTALGADCTINNGFIQVVGLPPMKLGSVDLTTSAVIASVTQVLQVTTLTPTASQNSTEFGISIQYINKTTMEPESKIFTYTSDASMTATEVCDNFRTQINACDAVIPIIATGTTTLILTAVTGTPGGQQFTVTAPSTYPGVWTSITTGTAAVAPVGLGSDLKKQCVSDAVAYAALVDASYYYQVIMDYKTLDSTGSAQISSNLINRNVLYVLATADNRDLLVGTYGTLTMAIKGIQATWTAMATQTVDFGSNLATRSAGSFFTENLAPGDAIYVGASANGGSVAKVYMPYTDGATAANFIFTKATIDNAATVTTAATWTAKFVTLI
jgi:hypothetical protein